MSTLFLVATPIGNLEDITMRAVRILGEVSLIAAEDTRRTRVLLNHFNIHSKLISYHEHNKLIRVDTILDALENGDVALVSDAGTPALNDPGYLLVRTVLERGFQVSPIPGPCAPLAALVASGLPTDKFTYLGYFPRKKGERISHLEKMKNISQTLVYLESPNRLMITLVDLMDIFGDRKIAVARELTKIHEEIFRGALSDAAVHFEENPPRGEITIVIAGALAEDNKWLSDQVIASIKESLGLGKAPSEIAKELAKESGWQRREVYNLITEVQKNPSV
jgi:16S rRNA (cytidine1402-2'-O)-methyltransferase